jgi:2'-5' RNA ligase
MPETALITRVPEAEQYISRYRDRYDPSARRNVPAHVTILYPFMDPALVTDEVRARLRRVAAAVPRFSYRIARTERFPVALYLAPDPDRPYSALIDGVFAEFPDYPPFEGKFDTIVPHITVAHGDEPLLCEIDVALRIALPGAGIAASCQELVLIENSSGRWEQMDVFPLGLPT